MGNKYICAFSIYPPDVASTRNIGLTDEEGQA